jgi:hypothetical protein
MKASSPRGREVGLRADDARRRIIAMSLTVRNAAVLAIAACFAIGLSAAPAVAQDSVGVGTLTGTLKKVADHEVDRARISRSVGPVFVSRRGKD